ncbi:MAG: glycoside hydrolase family 76 protein [Prevotellaceae bacterium]|nr:glycoside hydrolase family 76 protein [Prevotellaceae bacterium]
MGKTIILTIAVMFTLTACGHNDVEPFMPPGSGTKPDTGTTDIVYHQRAKELFDVVNRLYRITPTDEASLYREDLHGSDYSFLWPFDGMISGAAALYRLGYPIAYEAMVDNYEKYSRPYAGDVSAPGYGSATNGSTGSGTRFYDDNAIVGVELVEAYVQTRQQKYLDRSAVVYAFLQSGLDTIMGEALWWNEDQRNRPGMDDSNKPACANGYATYFLLNYHAICPQTKKDSVLLFAQKLYEWLRTNLQDQSDKTYWNDKNVSGRINQTKWTYNSGVMILNGLLLFQITGEQRYLHEANGTAIGAYNYFVKPRNGLPLAYPDHDPWFNTKLLKAYIEIAPYLPAADTYVNTYIQLINHGYNRARTDNGLFYEDWTGASQGRYTNLLHQAAVIESYALIALYGNENIQTE